MKKNSSNFTLGVFSFILLFANQAFSANLPDTCSTQAASTSVTDGNPVCISNNGTAWLSIGGASSHNSVAITAGHGTGDLNLYVDQGRWPSTASNSVSLKSITPGTNKECVVINNPSQHWLMIGITGTRDKASLVVDFGATSCRSADGGSPDPIGNTGSVNAPNNVAGTAVSSAINLTWSDNSNNEDNFVIQRSSAGIPWTTIATLDANTTSYIDSGLAANTNYNYIIHAKNSTNTSSWSTTATVRTLEPDTPPDPGTNAIYNACSNNETVHTDQLVPFDDSICVPNGSWPNAINYYRIEVPENTSKLTIRSDYGTGNGDIYYDAASFTSNNSYDQKSTNSNNTETIIVNNPAAGSHYISVIGERSGMTLLVETDVSTTNPDPNPNPTTGENIDWNYDSVHLNIYPVNFPDHPVSWPNLRASMDKTVQYYTEQSYGKFTVTYTIHPTRTTPQNSSYYISFNNWSQYRSTIPGFNTRTGNNITMVTVDQTGTDPVRTVAHNSTGGNPNFTVFRRQPRTANETEFARAHREVGNDSTIVHELGHAVGLLHARGVTNDGATGYRNSFDYGNPASLMGMGGNDFSEINLVYKDEMGWLSNTEVPTITTSGTYRIYAFDHGSASGTNAAGIIGLKLKSGNNGEYTYFVEYRTTGKYANEFTTAYQSGVKYAGSKNGVLLNLKGYLPNTPEANLPQWYLYDKNYKKTVSQLVDTTPRSQNLHNANNFWAQNDWTDAHLEVGKTYTDRWGGFRIKTLRTGGTEDTANAWIEVEVTIL